MNEKEYKRYLIKSGIGLQKVDGLETSTYLKEVSEKYIKSDIEYEEAYRLIDEYYKVKEEHINPRNEEADKVSLRIADVLYDNSFTFTPGQLLSIHRRLFEGVFEHAGKLREFNFSKKEWVLGGESVSYGDYRELEMTLDYDFSVERRYNYRNKSNEEIVSHLAEFVSNLWQIHPFEEGNTRTTAVFFIKYLRSLGYDVTNDTFAENAWYFRNSLVRANYTNLNKNIYSNYEYIKAFLKNLLFNEKNVLENKDLLCNSNNENDSNELTKLEDEILKLIKLNKYIKSDQIAESISKSIRTVKGTLISLQSKGIIARKNGKRYGYWEIK